MEQLIEQTTFVCYNLDYSLRNSREITEFVKATSEIIESTYVAVSGFKDIWRSKFEGILIDDQQCRERNAKGMEKRKPFLTKVLYHQNNHLGHSVSCGPVSIYYAEENQINNQKDLYRAYIATLSYILQDLSEDMKFVICTYDKDLYNIVDYFLCKSKYNWTTGINEFMKQESDFNLLLTDYASVRGYEFSNVIFLLPFGKKYLIYRSIECMTRATSKLHIITDESNKENTSMDKQLLKKWKELKCVNFINLKYNRSNDTFRILMNKNELQAVRYFSKMYVGKNRRYPWGNRKVNKIERDSKIVEDIYLMNHDHIRVGLICVVSTDNVTLLIEFSEMNNVDLKSYKDKNGKSVLHFASVYCAVNILKLLIDDYHMNVNCDDSPLHYACIYGHIKIIEVLSDSNADINTGDSDGNKAIHIAAQFRHKHVEKKKKKKE